MDKAFIKQKRLSAPEDIRDLIYSFDIDDLEEKITMENKLTKEQANKLREGAISVLIGITKISDFPKQLTASGIPQDMTKKITNEVEEKIFNKVRASLEKVQSDMTSSGANNAPESFMEESLNRENLLSDIENPVPTKPIVLNPAGNNPILDAQHNLPEQEKKILISSAAVPSRGPMLGNFKIQPVSQPPQTIQSPQPPITQAPSKYVVDPYRESAE